MKGAFLIAEWRKLAMANYAVDQSLLMPYLQHKTELDLWNNTCYVSLVGFSFLNTKVKGIGIPFHKNFEEVNLRFYCKYKEVAEWKRGVVFIKEIVPKPALTFVANTIYKENYETMQMDHSWLFGNDNLTVQYRWKNRQWNSLKVITEPVSGAIVSGSEEEFITEHYWGYTKRGATKTSEYGVEHQKWDVYKTISYQIDVDFAATYGSAFGFLKSEIPKSVFLAEGSEIVVKDGKLI
jgi:uncharacterized protein YqjF (DUF2071 family)